MINVINPNKSDWKSLVKRPYFNNKSIVKTIEEIKDIIRNLLTKIFLNLEYKK